MCFFFAVLLSLNDYFQVFNPIFFEKRKKAATKRSRDGFIQLLKNVKSLKNSVE